MPQPRGLQMRCTLPPFATDFRAVRLPGAVIPKRGRGAGGDDFLPLGQPKHRQRNTVASKPTVFRRA